MSLTEWYASQYVKSVNLEGLEGGHFFKSMLKSFPVANSRGEFPMSGRTRTMERFSLMKFLNPINQNGYSCIAMKVAIAGNSCIYAYAYWDRGATGGTPNYICAAPTYESQDGEYRARFMHGNEFLTKYGKHCEVIDQFETTILELISAGSLEISSQVYATRGADQLAAQADNLRIPVITLAVYLAQYGRAAMMGYSISHQTVASKAVLSAIMSHNPKLAEIDRVLFGRVLNAFSQLDGSSCGQKLVPMHVREVMQPLDCNLAVWRELAVMRAASDLVLNFVSPGFALYNQWSFVEGASENMFENLSMHAAYARARVTEKAAESLRDSRRSLSASSGYYINELGARIYESVEFAQNHLIMSRVAMLHLVERVGGTVATININKHRFSDMKNVTDMGVPHVLFGLAYSAHCLHSKVGVCHADLHGNNMTLYTWAYSSYKSLYGPNPIVAYVAGPRGEADTYVFDATGVAACIIDYSRSILGPGFRSRLEKDRSPQYADNIYRDQVNRVMRVLHGNAQVYVEKHQDKLKSAIIADFNLVFPVLCSVDFISIGAAVEAAMVRLQASGVEIKDLELGIQTARRLEEAAREMFITGLQDIVSGDRDKNALYPGAALFEKIFGEWRFPRWAARAPSEAKSAQLVDAYNYNNPVEHEGENYAKWPSWAKIDEIERHLGDNKMTDLFSSGVEPLLDAMKTGSRVEVVAETVRAEQEKLDGRPVNAASSWLEGGA